MLLKPVYRFAAVLILLQCHSSFCMAQSSYADSLIAWVKAYKGKPDSIYVLNLHRISYRLSETDVEKSFQYYQRVQELSDSMNFISGKALAEINLSLLLFNSGNYSASNDAYFKAIDYAEQSGFTRLKAVSLNNIGENFKSLRNYAKCREYVQQAIEFNSSIKAWRGVGVNYELLHQCDLEEGNYKASLEDLKKGMGYAVESKDDYLLAQYYIGFGKLKAIAGDNDSASIFFEKALAISRKQNDLRNEHLLCLAKAKYLKNIPAAERLQYLDRALDIARQTDYLKGISDASEQLTQVYDGLNNKDSSLFYYRSYRSASDSLFSENNRRNVVIKESEWKIKKTELENNHLKQLSGLQQKELKNKNLLMTAAVIGLLLTIALGGLLYWSFQTKKKKAEAVQKQQEAELKNQMTELEFKAFKAQLNPHFIFNYLNAISFYILQNNADKASGMISRFSKLLRNVLQSSEQNLVPLADDITTIERYVELMHEMSSVPFTYTIVADKEVRNLHKAVPPLFIQPYIENAILHGIRQSDGSGLFLKVQYTKQGNDLVVQITDNGTGFDIASWRQAKKFNNGHVHLGMNMTEKRILIFAQQHGYDAGISYDKYADSDTQPGTEIKVLLKEYFV